MATLPQFLERLRGIRSASDPYPEIESTLRLLSDPDMVSALVENSEQDALTKQTRSFLDDVFDSPWSYQQRHVRAPRSLISGGNVQGWTGLGGPRFPGRYATQLNKIRDVKIRQDPGRMQRARQGFLGNPFAQGAAEALRRRATDPSNPAGRGAIYSNRMGSAHFGRLDSTDQQRLQGEAAAFGHGRNAFLRQLLGNTPRGRGARATRSGFLRA